jgi:phage gpG-like protein
MSIAVGIDGGDALVAKLAGLPDALTAQLRTAFGLAADALYAQAIANVSGAVVNARSGRLQAAITQASDASSASIGVDSGVAPYGPALEFGASIPAQLIAAKNAKALTFVVGAFVVGGSQVFAKHVMHPAFVLPPHSFLRSALADLAPDLVAMVGDAVAEALQS